MKRRWYSDHEVKDLKRSSLMLLLLKNENRKMILPFKLSLCLVLGLSWRSVSRRKMEKQSKGGLAEKKKERKAR